MCPARFSVRLVKTATFITRWFLAIGCGMIGYVLGLASGVIALAGGGLILGARLEGLLPETWVSAIDTLWSLYYPFGLLAFILLTFAAGGLLMLAQSLRPTSS